MILAGLLAAQSIVTLAPPIREARPATTWSCDYIDAEGQYFVLRGRFAEAPKGTDPNAELPTVIEGTAPAFLVGQRTYNAFDSLRDARRYQVTTGTAAGVRYNLSFLFARETEGLSFITRFTPNPAGGRGKLVTFATGQCATKFHETGAGASTK